MSVEARGRGDRLFSGLRDLASDRIFGRGRRLRCRVLAKECQALCVGVVTGSVSWLGGRFSRLLLT